MSTVLDLYLGNKRAASTATSTRSKKSVRSPPNYSDNHYKQLNDNKTKHYEPNTLKQKSKPINYELEKLKRKRNWDMSISPSKSIPMNAIMMYFSPNSLQLIPIMMTLMLFVNSIKEMLNVNEKFMNIDVDDDYDRHTLKLVYLLCCCGNLLIGVVKLHYMGLIPDKSADWLAWEPTLQFLNTVVI
ncbi:unnamed protein product [Ambrosiozyma monospora]|uniref:ER membrane protein complex subunit 4 n=1 Tax=Ambrosiozyma monospora TaxID=43982 RepID=A0A9W7DGF0_AMBMO|nr:unnamed protein product [Ambrosiozyma monospora]